MISKLTTKLMGAIGFNNEIFGLVVNLDIIKRFPEFLNKIFANRV